MNLSLTFRFWDRSEALPPGDDSSSLLEALLLLWPPRIDPRTAPFGSIVLRAIPRWRVPFDSGRIGGDTRGNHWNLMSGSFFRRRVSIRGTRRSTMALRHSRKKRWREHCHLDLDPSGAPSIFGVARQNTR